MSDKTVLHEVDESGVLRVTLNRPEVSNAFSDVEIKALTEIFTRGASDPAVRMVLLQGQGKHLSGGGDLAYMKRMSRNSYEENLEDAKGLAGLMQSLNDMPQPTVVKVQGAAYAGGFGLVCCCDIAIGSERARFCLSEVKVGLAPATIAPYVIAAIGLRAAKRYSCSAEVLDADKALQLGLLSEVVAEDALDETVEKLLESMLANAPLAMQKAKQITQEIGAGLIDKKVIEDTAKFIAELRDGAEAKEGLSAFLEKRKPQW